MAPPRRSVVRDALGWITHRSTDYIQDLSTANPVHARAPVDIGPPLPEIPARDVEGPRPPSTPSPNRPMQRAPDTIDGYASQFSRMMMGPSGPRPSTDQALQQEPRRAQTPSAPREPSSSDPRRCCCCRCSKIRIRSSCHCPPPASAGACP